MRRVPLIMTVALLAAACGGGGEPTSETAGGDDTETAIEEEDTSGSEDYSVLMVGGVDSHTANGQLSSLEEAGFDGFVLEESDSGGYSVYAPGLSRQDAEDLLDEVRAELFPEASEGGIQPGLIVETASIATSDSEDAEVDAAGGNYAIVTVGDMTYEFPPDALNTCNNFGNIIGGSFAVGVDGNAVQAGGSEVAAQINFTMPESDWEAEGLQRPGIILDEMGEVRWLAREGEERGAVESWDLSEGLAEGTATFFGEDNTGEGREIEPVSGSFEIFCGPTP